MRSFMFPICAGIRFGIIYLRGLTDFDVSLSGTGAYSDPAPVIASAERVLGVCNCFSFLRIPFYFCSVTFRSRVSVRVFGWGDAACAVVCLVWGYAALPFAVCGLRFRGRGCCVFVCGLEEGRE
jgi:hypothetical protein